MIQCIRVMERGKNSQSRGKSKTQHFPADLFALGTKSSGNDSSKRPLSSSMIIYMFLM